MVRIRRNSARRSAWVLKALEGPGGASSAARNRASSVMVAIIGAGCAPAIEPFRAGKVETARAVRPSHLLGKRLNNLCGAGWRVRTTFLGAVRSLWGLSLSRLVGFGIWFPPTYVGARDQRPTAVSAPRSIVDVFFGLATL